MKGSWVHRHHKVCDLLAIEVERDGWIATMEFNVEIPEGELRIPDLVCTKESTARIIDVTIQYEVGSASLQRVAHYQPIVSQFAAMVGEARAKVMGFLVGAQGKWPLCNNETLTELGIAVGRRASFAMLVSRRTLLYSVDVLRDFMVWR